jgi:hypothetical protein
MITIIILSLLAVAIIIFSIALYKADKAMMCRYCDRKRERRQCMECIENNFDKFKKE